MFRCPCAAFRCACATFRCACAAFRCACATFRCDCATFRCACAAFRCACATFRCPCATFRCPCATFRCACATFRWACATFRCACTQGAVSLGVGACSLQHGQAIRRGEGPTFYKTRHGLMSRRRGRARRGMLEMEIRAIDGLGQGSASPSSPELFRWEGSHCEADASASRGVSEARAGTTPVTGERRRICRSRSSQHDRPNGIVTAQFPTNTLRVVVPTKTNPCDGVPKMKYGSVIPGYTGCRNVSVLYSDP